MTRDLAFVSIAFLASVSSTGQQPAPVPVVQAQGALILDRAEERTISSAAPHVWTVEAAEGHFVEIAVENLDVDVSIVVQTPALTDHRKFDHGGYSGTRVVRWLAVPGGPWRLRIAASGDRLVGRYRIRFSEHRPANARDRAVVDADGLIERAELEKGYAETEDLLQQALSLVERAAGKNGIENAIVLGRLADFNYNVGRFGDSCTYLERALAIEQEHLGPDSLEVAVTLNNLGFMYEQQGLYEQAEPRLVRARDIRADRLGPDHVRVGITLDNLAVLYIRLGRYADAEWSANRAKEIFEQQLGPNHQYVPFALNILASVYQIQGQYEAAGSTITRALAIDEATVGLTSKNYASSLARLAANVLLQGRPLEAEVLYQRALAINEKVWGADHPIVAFNLWNLGRVRSVAGDPAGARALFEKALSIEREKLGSAHPTVAQTLISLARAEFSLPSADLANVRAWLDQALTILDASAGNRAARVEAYSLRAQLSKRNNAPEKAIEELGEALRLVEELRPQTSGGEEVRASFFELYTSHFNRMINWQIDAGNLGRAFEYIERSRARALLDQLAAGQINLRSSIDPDVRSGLELREKIAKTRMAELQGQIAFMRSRTDLPDADRLKELAILERSLIEVDREYQRAYADIKNASRLWRDQVTSGGQPITLATVQRELVPRGGVVLVYQIGGERSQLWVIPPAGQTAAVLPLRVDPAQARTLGIREGDLTTGMLQSVVGGRGNGATGSGLIQAIGTASPPRGVRATTPSSRIAQWHGLWQVLIPDSLWARLAAMPEVVIIPDASLHELPFEALVTVPRDDASGTRYWLDDGPVIRYAPSATVLYNLSRRAQSRTLSVANARTVLSVSDPIYDATEAAASRSLGTTGTSVAFDAPPGRPLQGPTRNSFERMGGSLARLPGTALESDAIVKAFGAEAVRSVIVLQRMEADEPRVRAAIQNKRYLHLATHALVGGGRSALFASLALTPSSNAMLDSDADGLLQLHEIYELKLPDVELAVLSACDTNRGPSLDGEGVFALSRGFLAAGARRVIASQWAVNDASTAALMSALFTQVVEAERAGARVDYAQALRDGKRAVRKRREWADPYYWAPFVLTGRD